MFHRVKPDTQQADQEPQEKVQEETQEMPAEEATPEAEVEQEIEQMAEEATEQTEDTEQEMEQAEESTAEEETSNTIEDQEDMDQEMQTEEVNQEQAAQTTTAPTSPYQRMTSGGASGYAASYAAPTASYTAPAAEMPVSMSAGDRRLTIGSGITMSGEIESCDYLLVEGTVEAALKGANTLEISESGTFYGTVEIGEATVAGRFEGDITVQGRLVVKAGGVITGTIAYGELEIEAGAIIDGRLIPVAAMQAAEKAAPTPKAKPAAANQAKPLTNPAAAQEDAANAKEDGGELFSQAS